jgi:uncharacterized protein (DUF305 family)
MKKQMAALIVAGGLAVAACGSDDESTPAAAGNGTDRAFVAAMIPHHEDAVKMAAIARSRGESAFVKDLADDIQRTQTDEIVLMRKEDAELAKAGVSVGKLDVAEHMVMDEDPRMLQNADPFDAAFIKMMIPHHEGAVEMAQEQLDKGEDPELKELAQNIVDAQKREIDAMLEHSKGGAGGDHSGGHDG